MPNKAFKTDSQRPAVSVQSFSAVFMALYFRLGGALLTT